jgi:hypothetical protein
VFEDIIGPSALSVDGYFGLGIQATDAKMLPPMSRAVIAASEVLRSIAERVAPLRALADSLYVSAKRQQ